MCAPCAADLHHRAPGPYPARARTREGLLRGVARDGGGRGCGVKRQWKSGIDPLLLSHALFQLGPHYAG